MMGIVLSRKDFREYDQIVSLYTREHGKIEALAKGIKKITSKNSGNLSLPALLEVMIEKGKEIDHLTKVQPIKVFSGIVSDLEKISLTVYCQKIVDDFTLTHEKDEKIFHLILSFMEFLDSARNLNSLNLATAFIFKLWHCFGFGVEDKKLQMWFEGDWSKINDLPLNPSEQQKIHDSAIKFAQYHSGRKVLCLGKLPFANSVS